jgi:hypothetical protein
VPVGVVAAVATVMIVLPEVVTDAGLYDAVALVGRPLALKVTVPVNPLLAVTVMV